MAIDDSVDKGYLLSSVLFFFWYNSVNRYYEVDKWVKIKTDKVSVYLDKIATINKKEYEKIRLNVNKIKNDFENFLIHFVRQYSSYSELPYSERRLIDYSSLQYQIDLLTLCVREIEHKKLEKIKQ